MENLVVSKSNNLTVERIESMSLGEIEKYGSDVQSEISDGMSKILESTKCIGLEKTGKSLSDLSVETNQISKKIGSVQKFPAFLKASKWLARYDSVEHRISSLEEGVVFMVTHDIRSLAFDMKQIGKDLEDATGYIKLYLVDSFGSDYWKEHCSDITNTIKEVYAL